MTNEQKLDNPIEVFGYFLDLALSSNKPIKDEDKEKNDECDS